MAQIAALHRFPAGSDLQAGLAVWQGLWLHPHLNQDGSPLSIAGLWSLWNSDNGEKIPQHHAHRQRKALSPDAKLSQTN
jgi:hypothetical protein